jgi:signal transduction histidine kinase
MENALIRLEQSFSQQRRFTGDAAHELKTAVAVVKSSLQLLSMKPRGVEQYRAGLEKCQADCARMEEIVGKMLTLARFENLDSYTTVTIAGTDLSESIRQVEQQFRSMAEVRGVSIHLDLQQPLSVAVQTDEVALLISNLLLNALQHSSRGTDIKITSQASPDCVEFTIRDQGEGIDPDALPHVFERFYRGDPSRNRNTGGTGLGLSICKAIVDSAGGEIKLESLPGIGTTATVKLPVYPHPKAPQPAEFLASATFPSA